MLLGGPTFEGHHEQGRVFATFTAAQAEEVFRGFFGGRDPFSSVVNEVYIMHVSTR